MARCKRKDHQKWAGVAYVTPASPTNVLRPVAFRHPWRFWAQDGCIGRRRKGLRAPAPARRRAPPAKHPHRDGGSGPPRSALRARARGRTSPSWTRRGGRGGGGKHTAGSSLQLHYCCSAFRIEHRDVAISLFGIRLARDSEWMMLSYLFCG